MDHLLLPMTGRTFDVAMACDDREFYSSSKRMRLSEVSDPADLISKVRAACELGEKEFKVQYFDEEFFAAWCDIGDLTMMQASQYKMRIVPTYVLFPSVCHLFPLIVASNLRALTPFRHNQRGLLGTNQPAPKMCQRAT